MLKRMLFFLLCLFSLFVYGQDSLHLHAEVAGLPDDSVAYLRGFASDDLDSAIVKDHQFRFDRVLKGGGDVYTIRMGKNKLPQSAVRLYLGPGEVRIKGSWPEFNKAVVTGSSFVGDWNDVQAMMQSAAASGGDAASRKEKLATQGKDWVNAHPQSGVSAFVIEALISPAVPREEVLVWIKKLKPEAQNNAIARTMRYRYSADLATRVGSEAPAFSTPDAQGRTVSLADFRGKYVLVDFWASWCGPCRELNPILETMYDKCKDRNFTILSISIDQNRQAWLDAVKKDHLPWTQLIDQGQAGSMAKDSYHIFGVPANFLIDPNGIIVGVNIGDIPTLESKLPVAKK